MMNDTETKPLELIEKLIECSICLNPVSDPRILPCIHTFCLECLRRTADAAKKGPQQKMPCPLCRKEFTIPTGGVSDLQKNFFVESLMNVKALLQEIPRVIPCDLCKVLTGDIDATIPSAEMRCFDCEEFFCDNCAKVHQNLKATKKHNIVKIGSEVEEDARKMASVKMCEQHIQKPLDYYCVTCKKIVCVSCFVESHSSHQCKDVTTLEEEFRQTIEKNATRISSYASEIMLKRKEMEDLKTEILMKIGEKENYITRRSEDLKRVIDEHTKLLSKELSQIKEKRMKEITNKMDELDTCLTVAQNFEAYCKEVITKGTASVLCCSFDDLVRKADDIMKDHEEIFGRPHQIFNVTFEANIQMTLPTSPETNFVGRVQDTTLEFENVAVIVGAYDGFISTTNTIKINLHSPHEVVKLQKVPTTTVLEAAAAVYCDALYITGIGTKDDEIWTFNITSGWVKRAALVKGRRRHSVAFIDEVLYICGGFVDSDRSVLDSVEAYNALTNKCTTVGKLVHAVGNAGNCVSFKTVLYIFGGMDKDNRLVSHVQVYDTKQKTCTLLSKPIPRCSCLMRAALWETSVILLGSDSSFIFNLVSGKWEERDTFKTDVQYFGLIVENGRIYVIGGGRGETDSGGQTIWKCRDDIRYVPVINVIENKPIEWKEHARLPKPGLIFTFARMKY